MYCSAIIVAAGSSRRMGFDKLAANLEGIPVLAHTIAAFMRCPEITEIVLVSPVERLALLDETTFTKTLIRVDGGAERHFSVAAGLEAVSPEADFIAVHDAARPFVSQKDILAVLQAAQECGAASLARRVFETVKRADSQDFTADSVVREGLWFIETPQIFQAEWIRAAYKHVLSSELLVTDETSALESIGKKTKLVASTSPNPKITTAVDLKGERAS